jgi:hypothetical protein
MLNLGKLASLYGFKTVNTQNNGEILIGWFVPSLPLIVGNISDDIISYYGERGKHTTLTRVRYRYTSSDLSFKWWGERGSVDYDL